MSAHTHSEKHELHRQLVKRLRQQADDVRRLTFGLDEEKLATRTVAGKWSLKELVCHLWRVQQVFEGRIERMLADNRPPVARYDPEGDPEFDKLLAGPAYEALSGFQKDRDRFAGRLEALSPAEWHRAGQHPEFPHYDVHFQVEYMVHHEAHHIYQMYQRRAPLGKLPH
jgi:hypothetical protein